MSTQLVKASTQLSQFLGIEPAAMLSTIKAQCFKCDPAKVSDEQLAAFVAVANEMRVNPLLPGMLYAYPDGRGGIVPMMGPDGVFKKLAEKEDIESWEVTVYPDDPARVPTHAVAKIWRRGREHPLTFTAYFAEWKMNSNPNWNSRPRHMLTIRALKQCARQIIHGIPFDEDERAMLNVTSSTSGTSGASDQPAPTRPTPPARQGGVKAAKEAAAKEADADADKVVETVATEVVDDRPLPEPAPEAQKEPDPETQPDPGADEAKPRTQLMAGETTEVVVRVEESKIYTISKKPSIIAKVVGAFTGTVFHVGGADNPAWKAGGTVTLALKGMKLKSPAILGTINLEAGAIIPVVEKAEVSEASADADLF